VKSEVGQPQCPSRSLFECERGGGHGIRDGRRVAVIRGWSLVMRGDVGVHHCPVPALVAPASAEPSPPSSLPNRTLWAVAGTWGVMLHGGVSGPCGPLNASALRSSVQVAVGREVHLVD
jgi:hypothetical protein